jgi:threonine/homoserine/homoserine lactone efflux protein
LGALSPLLLQGFLFGWSVAWPPGPINAEIMRRGIERGFAPAYAVALGAASGDACWAVAAATGAGLVLTRPAAHLALGVISAALLLALGLLFLRGAWRAFAAPRDEPPPTGRFESTRAGYGLGLGMSLSSPWNVGFWLAVMGRPEVAQRGFPESLVVAGAVMAGALSWCLIITSAVSLLRIRVPTRWWEVVAKAATGLLLLGFAARGVLRLVSL